VRAVSIQVPSFLQPLGDCSSALRSALRVRGAAYIK